VDLKHEQQSLISMIQECRLHYHNNYLWLWNLWHTIQKVIFFSLNIVWIYFSRMPYFSIVFIKLFFLADGLYHRGHKIK